MAVPETVADSPAERRWEAGDLAANPPTLPQALSAAARTWPDAAALHFVDHNLVLTWSELEQQALTVAAGLNELGVRPGDRVGLLLGNVPAFPLGWLGILAAGAVAVPMNPKYTAREVVFIAEDTGMNALFVGSERRDILADLPDGCTITRARVVVDGEVGRWGGVSLDDLLKASALPRPYPLGTAQDLANIQYTSGTTGLPKGCMLPHGYWVLSGRMWAAAYAHTPLTNILADHPFFYLQNQLYFACGVITGAQTHVTHGLSLSRFVDWLHAFKIDLAWISDDLLSQPPSDRDTTHPLRYAPTDVIDPALHSELEKRFNLVVREWYASTEIGFGTISPWDDLSAAGSGSIGYPVTLRETKVIDGNLDDLPAGSVGELCVRGPAMMLGYWNRPEINEELFLDGGWFRTGDLVRIDPDGQHYFIGRAKDMVRRSGENIAAVEVEQQLEAHPAIATAAVIPVPDPRRGEEVKAILVLNDAASITPQEVRAWCRDRLASYKIPRYIAFRAELPHTPSGKIRKVELKAETADLREGAYDLVDEVQR